MGATQVWSFGFGIFWCDLVVAFMFWGGGVVMASSHCLSSIFVYPGRGVLYHSSCLFIGEFQFEYSPT